MSRPLQTVPAEHRAALAQAEERARNPLPGHDTCVIQARDLLEGRADHARFAPTRLSITCSCGARFLLETA